MPPPRHTPPLILLFVVVVVGCGAPPAPAPPASPSRSTSDTPRADAPRTEPWTFESKPGRLISTPAYRLFTTTQQPMLLDRLPTFLEDALAHYRSAFGPLPAPQAPLESYLLANRPQWARFTQRLMGDRAGPYLRIGRGGFAHQGRAVLYDVGPRDTFALAAHEGWHQYTQSVFRQPLPVWLEEGLATTMEGFRWDPRTGRAVFLPWANAERFDQLRAAHAAGSLMPLRTLLISTPGELLGGASTESALTYYAQVWSFVMFLKESGDGTLRDRLTGVLHDAAAGTLDQRLLAAGGADTARAFLLTRRGGEFFRLAFGAAPEDVQASYDDFVARVVAAGSKQRITEGRSPIAP